MHEPRQQMSYIKYGSFLSQHYGLNLKNLKTPSRKMAPQSTCGAILSHIHLKNLLLIPIILQNCLTLCSVPTQ